MENTRTLPTLPVVRLLLVLCALIPAQAQTGLGLTPMKREFPAIAGKAHSGALSLSNSSAKSVRVRAEILDFFIDDNQTPQFVPEAPAESRFSCRQWLTVNPMETEVGPASQLPVRYTLRVPAGAAEGSYHCAVGFVSMPTAEEMKGIGVRTMVRVVAAFYPVIGKPAIQGKISKLQLQPVTVRGATRWRSVLVLDNSGLMLYRPQGTVEVLDAQGKLVERLAVASFPVLPRRQQRFLLPLSRDLVPGSYRLRAHVDIGPEVQEATVEVSAVRPQ